MGEGDQKNILKARRSRVQVYLLIGQTELCDTISKKTEKWKKVLFLYAFICTELGRKGSMFLSDYYSEKAHQILATVNAHGAWASVKTGTMIGRKLRKTV